MDSRSGLPMKNRRRRLLHLMEHDNSSSLIFFLEICDFIASVSRSAEPPAGDNPHGCAWRGRALVGWAHPGAPLRWFLAPEILFYYIKNPRKVSFHSENFYFCTKNNTMVVLLKTASVRVTFIQIMQIRVQNKRKSVRKSRYVGDVSASPS